MPRRNTRKTKKVEIGGNVTVGDTVQLNGPANMVRLPDGAVVTTRGEYICRHEGEHTVIDGDGNESTFTGKAKG